MRILVITPYFYPHIGGSQQYILELYSRLVSADPKLHVDVLCYNTDHAALVERYRGLTIYRVPAVQILPSQFALPNYWQVYRLLKKLKDKHGNYDIVNSHTRFFDNSWWAPMAAKYLGAKSVLTDHCAEHPYHNSRLVRFITYTIDSLWVPVFVNMYNQVTVVSKATKDFLKSLTGVSGEVMYPGIDPELFHSEQNNTSRKVPRLDRTFKQADVLITFVGRMIPAKGVALFVKAAQRLSQIYPHVYFLLAGDGPLMSTLKKNASDKIYFLGQLSHDEIGELLNVSNICVHPSSHHEGFPLVVTEAGASGCAVIATNQGGTNEIIVNGETGLIIEPTEKSIEQKLSQLIENPTLRRRVAHNLHLLVTKKLHWPTLIKHFHATVLAS